jgi:hypothetical protein
MADIRTTDRRILRVITLSQWMALTVGIFAGIVLTEGSVESYLAAAAAGLYVLGTTAAPIGIYTRPLVLESVSLLGALLTMTAVALTGGTSSPYILISIIPPVAATVLGGLRPGITTALLNGAMLIAIGISAPDSSLISAVVTSVLYLVIVLTVGQIRRMLVDIEERAASLEASSADATKRLDELETTYELLTRLAELASDNTGPIAVGQAALETITSRIPGSAGSALLSTTSGPVVIARIGDGNEHPFRRRLPLVIGERNVGSVLISSPDPLTDDQVTAVDSVLEPVASVVRQRAAAPRGRQQGGAGRTLSTGARASRRDRPDPRHPRSGTRHGRRPSRRRRHRPAPRPTAGIGDRTRRRCALHRRRPAH